MPSSTKATPSTTYAQTYDVVRLVASAERLDAVPDRDHRADA